MSLSDDTLTDLLFKRVKKTVKKNSKKNSDINEELIISTGNFVSEPERKSDFEQELVIPIGDIVRDAVIENPEVEKNQLEENIRDNIRMASTQSSWSSLFKGLYDILRDSSYNITGKDALFEIINLMVLSNLEDKLEYYNDSVKIPIFKFANSDKFSVIFYETRKALKEANKALEKAIVGNDELAKNKVKDIYSELWSKIYGYKRHIREKKTNNVTEIDLNGLSPCTFTKIAKHPYLWTMISTTLNGSKNLNSIVPIESITKFHILDNNVSDSYSINFGKVLFRLMEKIDLVLYDGPEDNRKSIFELSTNFDGFGKAYEDMLKDTGDADRKKNGEFFTRRDICKFIIDELKPELNEVFADLSCGTGGFFYTNMEYQRKGISEMIEKGEIAREECQKILKEYSSTKMRGIELDSKTYKLLCLNILIQAPCSDMLLKFEKKNSLSILNTDEDNNPNINLRLNAIDVGGGNPPYGAKTEVVRAFITPDGNVVGLKEMQDYQSKNVILESYWGSLDKGKAGIVKNSTAQFMMLYLRALKNQGRCGLVIDRGILINGNDPKKNSWERDFRFEFMNLSHIWKIVLLPKGIFETTSFDTAIIFFKKGIPTASVEFVEGYFKMEDKGKGNKPMYVKSLGAITRVQIENKKYSLDPKDYFGQEESTEEEQFVIPCEWIEIEKVCDIGRGISVTSETKSIKDETYKYPVMGGGLKYLGYYKEYNTESNVCLIHNGGEAGRVLRRNEKIYINSDCFSLKSKVSTLDNNYLFYIVKLFEKKFRNKKHGGGLKHLSKYSVDLTKITIPINMEEQERIVKFCDYIFGESDVKPDFITFDIERQNYQIDIAVKHADDLYRYLLNERYIEFVDEVKLAHYISYLPDIPLKIKINEINKEYEKNPDEIYDLFIIKQWNLITKDIEMKPKKIIEFCEINLGKNINSKVVKQKDSKNKYPVLGGGKKYLGYYSEFNTEPNICLMSRGGDAGFVSRKNESICTNCDCFSLKTTGVLSNDFIFFLLKSFQNLFKVTKKGGGLQHVSRTTIENIELPIPTNPDDINRIVEYLERKTAAFNEYYS